MRLSSFFRRSLWLALPAVLAFSGCSDDSDPAPQQGRIYFLNGAANVNVATKVLIDDVEKNTLTYGQTATYQAVNVGSRTIKINGGTTTLATQPITVEANKSYSYFIYNPGTSNATSGLLLTDDLTAPATTPSPGKAKVRLVHIAQGLGTPNGQGTAVPINLSEALTVGYADRIPGVAFGTGSSFLEINAGNFNLAITAGTAPANPLVFNVGNGTGTGTGTYNYVAGKIYTIVVRGAASNLDTTLQPKVYVIQNN